VIGSKATATFTSQNGKAESLQMKGSFFDTSADITDKAQNSKTHLSHLTTPARLRQH
jgi:hypothetical protein